MTTQTTILSSATPATLPDFLNNPDSADPHTMFIIIHNYTENGIVAPTETTVSKAIADALYRMFSNPNNTETLNEWCQGKIRKIVKRANGTRWTKTIHNPLITVGEYKDTQVAITLPVRKTETPPEIKKLQVAGLQLRTDTPTPETERHLKLVINEQTNLTDGKTVAQIGHAIQLFLMTGTPEQIQHWVNNNYPTTITRGPVTNSTPLMVKDAGLSEVPHGTATIAASFQRG